MERLHALEDADGRRVPAGPSAPADEYLRRIREACSTFIDLLADAARRLESDGDFPAAAATHRRFTRQFLDAQCAILRRRALSVAEAEAIEAEAAPAARATVDQAYEIAGVPRPDRTEADGGASPPDQDALVGDEWSEAAGAGLQALLDAWWQSELAVSDALIERADDAAELVRSLARIEAGEILAEAEVPSPLPPPTAALHDRELLPPVVADVLAAADASELIDVCDTLLRALGSEPPSDEPGVPSPCEAPSWVPPTFVAPSPAPTVVERDERDERDGQVGRAVAPAPTREEAFHRFWGEGPEAQRSRGLSLVRQTVVTMLAFTGVLALVMAMIG